MHVVEGNSDKNKKTRSSDLTNCITRSPEMAPRLVYRNKKYGRKSCPTSLQVQDKDHEERRPSSLSYIKTESYLNVDDSPWSWSPSPEPPPKPSPSASTVPSPCHLMYPSSSSLSNLPGSSQQPASSMPASLPFPTVSPHPRSSNDDVDRDSLEELQMASEVYSSSPVLGGQSRDSIDSPRDNRWVSEFSYLDTLQANISTAQTSSLGSEPSKALDYSAFTAIDPLHTGHAPVSSILEYWESLGISHPAEVLLELGLSRSDRSEIDLRHLTFLLEEEINQSQDIFRYSTIKTGLQTFLNEARVLKPLLDNSYRERDKLRLDVQESNQRLSVLVQEVDEQNAKQEQDNIIKFQKLECRWQESLRELHEKAEEENQTNLNLVKSLTQELRETTNCHKEEKDALSADVSKLKKENSRLESENAVLTTRLKTCSIELSEQNQTRKIHDIPKQGCDESLSSGITNISLLEKEVERLTTVNKELQDRNDELQTMLQSEHRQIQRLNSQNVQIISVGSNDDLVSSSPRISDLSPRNESFSTNENLVAKVTVNCAEDEDEMKSSLKKVISDLLRHPNPVKPTGPASLPPFTTNGPTSKQNRNGGEVLKLEEHCRNLEGELDQVKFEIIRMLSERAGYSKENETLKQYRAAFQQLQRENENLRRELEDLRLPARFSPVTDSLETMQRSSPDGQEHQDNGILGKENLQERISQLEQEKQQETTKYKEEIHSYETKIQELEESLELMKSEFESMEDYWQRKLDEERNFYEEQLRKSEEQFRELENRLKDYEVLLVDNKDEDRLSTIDESSSMEQQVTEWEQEILVLREQLENQERETTIRIETLQEDWRCEVAMLEEQINKEREKKPKEISTKDQILQTTEEGLSKCIKEPSASVWGHSAVEQEVTLDENRSSSQQSKYPSFTPHTPVINHHQQGPSSLPTELVNTAQREVRRLQELRRIIQEECDSLLLRKERLKEEVGQSFSIWFNSTWPAMQNPAASSRIHPANRMKGFRAWSLDMLDGASTELLAEAGDTVGVHGSTTAWNSPTRGKVVACCHGTSTATFGSGSLEYDELVQDLLALGEQGGAGLQKKDAWKDGAQVLGNAQEQQQDGGEGAEGGQRDAWTQVPSFGESDVQTDTLSSIAMAYKVLGANILHRAMLYIKENSTLKLPLPNNYPKKDPVKTLGYIFFLGLHNLLSPIL